MVACVQDASYCTVRARLCAYAFLRNPTPAYIGWLRFIGLGLGLGLGYV